MTRTILRLLPVLLLLSACAAPGGPTASSDETDLGYIDAKADGATSVREVNLDLGPGEVKRFRVTAVRFHAALANDSDTLSRLSAKHYEVEVEGEAAVNAELDAQAPEEMLRNWTLRVENVGTTQLTGLLTITSVEELPADDGSVIREVDVEVEPGTTKRFRVSGGSIRAELTQEGESMAQLSAKNYDIDVYGDTAAGPFVIAESPDATVRNWTIRVANLGDATLVGHLTVTNLVTEPTPGPTTPGGVPSLADPIQYENQFCTYADSAPYVASVRWDDPMVQQAMSALLAGYRSVLSFTEWRVAYGLENERTGTELEMAQKKARNFMRVLCGEHRDYPDMLRAKLEVIGEHTSAASPNELTDVDTTRNLFDQLTYPAYVHLVEVMRTMHAYRQGQMPGVRDGYNYGQRDYSSRRVDHGVAPFTQCEMKFAFSHYLVAGAPHTIDPARYEAELADYSASSCTDEDLAWMFNFRGHVNLQPLWLESNAFIFNSRRARGVEISRGTRDAYLHPFATRYDMSRRAWAAYLFHRDEDSTALNADSLRGGGPIMYITDQDQDEDGVADYRLFDVQGCGDQGVGLAIPSQNCNMVTWEQARWTNTTRGHASAWDPSRWSEPGMGFMQTFASFDERMTRFNQALDRHTNWGPTGYYMIDASAADDTSPRFYAAYSPVVAASYDVSASDFFVHRDYPTTSSFEAGRAKWLHVMRFRTSEYYDEQDLADGRAMDFDANYFNETSLSNDYYSERALDHVGFIPEGEMYAQVYLTYGDRGETAPAPTPVPAP